jgi:hypothetical protein
VTASKEYLLQIRMTRRWSFPFQDMGDIDAEIGLKISLAKASEKILYRAKNFREI